MANNELTYNDFLQRLNIQELLVDAGYQLNKRDGLRYPSLSTTVCTLLSQISSSSTSSILALQSLTI